MRLRRLLSACTFVACVTYLSACGDIPRTRVEVRPESVSTTNHSHKPQDDLIIQRRAMRTLWLAEAKQRDDIARWTAAAIKNAETVRTGERARAERMQRVIHEPRAVSAPSFGNLADVVQCIKDHESGDYNEHSHTSDGSGAYQYIPGTWRAWSARAGHAGYDYAYQAPPSVQDAVLLYTLTHGGAGNWSNRFGSDPCTQGMGG